MVQTQRTALSVHSHLSKIMTWTKCSDSELAYGAATQGVLNGILEEKQSECELYSPSVW